MSGATLITTNAVWKYLDTGIDQGSAWKERSFDDSSWHSGLAQLGYGDGDEATILSYGPDASNKRMTTYFRRQFVLSSGVTNVILRLLRDDGAIVYVNGAEARRDNMPAGSVTYSTTATVAVNGADENTFFQSSVPNSLFVAGTNVVAVEVHQSAASSSDLSFALELLADLTDPPANTPPTVFIAIPADGDAFTAPEDILVFASVEDPDGSARNATIEFFAGAQSLGMGQLTDPGPLHAAAFRFLWASPPPGSYVLTAKAVDEHSAVAFSAPVHVTINPPPPTNHPPYVKLNAPQNGDSFTSPTNIVLQAYAQDTEDGNDLTVDFFAGTNKLGAGGFVPTRCPSPFCPYFELTWSNVPPGSYSLTARATDKSGATSNSEPITITVQPGATTGDRELHAIGIYSGVGAGGSSSANHEQGQAAVTVNRPGKRVTLLLSSQEPVLWHVTTAANTVIERVILGGYYRQAIDGIAPGVEIIPASFDQGHGTSQYLWLGYLIDSLEFYQGKQRLCTLFGMDLSSFQGSYTAPYPAAFTIDTVQSDPRLRCDYPQPVDAAQLPDLSFQIAFFNPPASSNVFFRHYTLAGCQDGPELLPAMRVVADSSGRYYYGADWQSIWKVDSRAASAQIMPLPRLLAQQGWPMGVAFDSQRQRIVAVSLGGEGYLYTYAPTADQWSLISSMHNLDVDCLEYFPSGDALYALKVSYYGLPVVYRFNADGALQGQIALPFLPFNTGPSQYQSALVAVGAYLVLLLEPTYPTQPGSDSRIYLINPNSGEIRLTYRHITTAPNVAPAVRITSPAEADFIPLGTNRLTAQAFDEDGIVETVEFFANGASLGFGQRTVTNVNTFALNWISSQPDWFTLTARATDTQGATRTSPIVRVVVGTNAPDPEMPNLNFALAFNNVRFGGNVFFRHYTLTGSTDGLRLLPASRVVTDSSGRYYYGADWGEVWRVDAQNGNVEELAPPGDLEEWSWPMGVAYDSVRHRILVVTLSGEGFLYAYSPTNQEWSVVSSMNNHDLENLVYHPPTDSFYGLEPVYGGAPTLKQFDATGALVGEIPLPAMPFQTSLGGYASELASVGDYLVLLLEPDYINFGCGPAEESRIYFIDPRTGQVRLTYRRLGVLCDYDGDGVPDSQDTCPNTTPGAVVDAHGCSLAQLSPCDGPWANHAAYVRSVIQHAWEFYRQGRITADQRRAIQHDAVMSHCGRHEGAPEPVCMHLLPRTLEECRQDGVQFLLSGDYTGQCVVETSSDMIHWTVMDAPSETVNGEEAACPAAHDGQGTFYRVRLAP